MADKIAGQIYAIRPSDFDSGSDFDFDLYMQDLEEAMQDRALPSLAGALGYRLLFFESETMRLMSVLGGYTVLLAREAVKN
jgi:hypothetical protein